MSKYYEDKEQEEFLRKYNKRSAEMRNRHRKLQRIVKTIIGVTIGVIVVSVLVRVGMLLFV